jgi:hypothetical protein
VVQRHRVTTFSGVIASLMACGAAWSAQGVPESPADFLPGGILGVQIGSPWQAVRQSPAFGKLTCQPRKGNDTTFDEVCFFKAPGRVGGAAVHDGFMVRKSDRLVLIGTGISIKNADDPIAEAVMRDLTAVVHAKFQHTGGDVLFVNLPEERMSAGELAGFSQTAPVLLVELEPKGDELAVLYGYLAPVNAFSVMSGD